MTAPRPRTLLHHGEASRVWLLGGILAILLLWVLHAAASVAVLVLGGVFAALIVAPLDVGVQRRVPGWLGWLGHLAALVALLVTLALLGAALAFCAMRLAGEFGTLAADGLPGGSGDASDGSQEAEPGGMAALMTTVRGWVNRLDLELASLATQAASYISGTLTSVLTRTLITATGLVLIVFLALIVLVDAPRWSERLSQATDRTAPWRGAVETLGVALRRYAVIRLGLGILTAALYGGWLWFMGVDLVWTWVILTVILAFVPTLGSIVSGVLPTVYALFTQDLGTALGVAAGLLVIEQVIGNFVDPMVAGKHVSVSPLVILAGLLVWGFVLGLAGTLLATPVTLVFIILGARIEALRPAAFMLSNCEDWDEFDRMTTA